MNFNQQYKTKYGDIIVKKSLITIRGKRYIECKETGHLYKFEEVKEINN